jgi:hypothetical protein
VQPLAVLAGATATFGRWCWLSLGGIIVLSVALLVRDRFSAQPGTEGEA